MDNEFIVTETPNGSAYVKNAFVCYGEGDFIARINESAIRCGEWIETVEQALNFLDERNAQTTEIITREDFDALTLDSWDQSVLAEAEFLGWIQSARYVQIAKCWSLWIDHVDPDATMTRGEFDALSIDQRVELIETAFGDRA